MNYIADDTSLFWKANLSHQTNPLSVSSQSKPGNSDASDLFAQWLDLDRTNRFIVDRQGKVVWCRIVMDHEAPNDEQLKNIVTKIRVGGSLPTELMLPVLNAGALADAGTKRLALIENHDTGTSFIAHVVALGTSKTGPLGVTITSYCGLCDDLKADLRRLWELSNAEIRVVAMTFKGMTAQEIADDTDLSIDTVRTHIRRIYAKVGVNSREALFAALGPAIGHN